MILYYDRDGKPLPDVLAFAALFEERDYQRVAYTEINSEVHVSTVWLGINLSGSGAPPMIFETMVFGGECDQHQMRYATEAQAIEGHNKTVAKLRDLALRAQSH